MKKMPKFTPPFVYLDRDTFLEDEAKYNHEIEQEIFESELLREWLEGQQRGGEKMPIPQSVKK